MPAHNSSLMSGQYNSLLEATGHRHDVLPPLHDPLPPQLLSIAHGLALELLRSVSDELSATRAAAEAARQEAYRVGEALDALRGQRGSDSVASGQAEVAPRKAVIAAARIADAIPSAGAPSLPGEVEVIGASVVESAITTAEPALQNQKCHDIADNDSEISGLQEVDKSMSFGKFGRRLKRSGTATLSTCGDLCAATETLALMGVFMLGIVFEALVNIEDDEHPLTPVYALALSCSASLSCFVVSFTVLECYYIRMTRGALGMGGTSSMFSGDFEEVIESFLSLRAHARNSVWASLCLILLAAGLHIGKHTDGGTGWHVAIPMSSVALLAGAALVLGCVIRFRAAYRPLLWRMAGRM